MRFRHALSLLVVSLVFAKGAWAQGAEQKRIKWSKDLTTAFEEAKAEGKILMICVNARYVDGKKTEEPAAKGLREIVYKDPRVVAKSREFVCAFLTPASSSTEYGELRSIGIEGRMISPQHIFIHPDGKKVLLRKQYWSNGSGEKGIQTMLRMMDDAKKKLAGGGADAEADPDDPKNKAPGGAARAAWIRGKISEIVEGDRKKRAATINVLINNDKGGDCTTPLIILLGEHKKDKDTALLADLIRGLGRDKLVDASKPIADFLAHRKEEVRGTAAVSLEYIGHRDKAVVTALIRAAGKEKNVSLANHMYRALGRCGVGDSKARSLLLKKAGSSKSEFASYGPAIGLAYFEKDAKAARGVEKMLKKIGIPGSRRGGGQNAVKRSVLCLDPGLDRRSEEQRVDREGADRQTRKREGVLGRAAAWLLSHDRARVRRRGGDVHRGRGRARRGRVRQGAQPGALRRRDPQPHGRVPQAPAGGGLRAARRLPAGRRNE